MSPTRPKPLSELARAENVPTELREAFLGSERETHFGISPEEYQELIEWAQERLDISDTTYLVLGNYENNPKLGSIKTALEEYSHTRAYLASDRSMILPQRLSVEEQPLLALKFVADLVDHILVVIDSSIIISNGLLIELGMLLQEHPSKTDILLQEDFEYRTPHYIGYKKTLGHRISNYTLMQALSVFEQKGQLHSWSTKDDLLSQINQLVMQHTDQEVE